MLISSVFPDGRCTGTFKHKLRTMVMSAVKAQPRFQWVSTARCVLQGPVFSILNISYGDRE